VTFSHLPGGPATWRLMGIFGLLIAANIGAWTWAVLAFRDFPVLLGTALLAYSFGLRHALDADHIAAIDNVTRKLMRDKNRPTWRASISRSATRPL
jgi:nickel/cobalt transporter (NiCoT) family protein